MLTNWAFLIYLLDICGRRYTVAIFHGYVDSQTAVPRVDYDYNHIPGRKVLFLNMTHNSRSYGKPCFI